MSAGNDCDSCGSHTPYHAIEKQEISCKIRYMSNYYTRSGRKATGQVKRTKEGLTISGKKVFGIPDRYLSGLSGAERTARAKAIIKGRETGRRSRNSPGDLDRSGNRIKTPESKYTKRFRKRFG